MSCFNDTTLLELYDVIVRNSCHVFTSLGNGDFIHKNKYQTITLDMVIDEISRRGVLFPQE